MEYWARRLIHNQLSKWYGGNYFFYKTPDGNNIIKSSLQDSVKTKMENYPERYSRPVDTLLIDDIIYLLCKEDFYKKHFKKVLEINYPNGVNDIRNYLSRLIPIRNNLSHANPISMRQAEQTICYTNDFIDCVKEFYKKENLYMSYNVPQILKVVDSFGEEKYRENLHDGINCVIWSRTHKEDIRPGETYRIDIETDPSFNDDEFNIEWDLNRKDIEEFKNRKYFVLNLSNSHVSTCIVIGCRLISKKDWHKYGSYDDHLDVMIKVLPPLD